MEGKLYLVAMDMKKSLTLNEPTNSRYPTIKTNIVYAFKDKMPLCLNLITPPYRLNAHSPLIIYVPDVNDKNQVKQDERLTQLIEFSKRGYSVAMVSYRPHSSLKNMIKDVHTATRYLLDHSFKYGLDPYRYILFGEGFGAYLSCLTLLGQNHQIVNDEDIRRSPLRYKGCLMLEPPLNPNNRKAPGLDDLIETQTRQLPPFLVLNGMADDTLTDEQALTLVDILQQKALFAKLYNFEDASLDSDAFYTPYSLDLLFDFIKDSFSRK